MSTTNTDASSGIVSFSISAAIDDAIEQAAARDLLTKSAWVRRLVVRELRETGLIGTDQPIMGRAGRPKQRAA